MMIINWTSLWDPPLAWGIWTHVYIRENTHCSPHVKTYLPANVSAMELLSPWLEIMPWIWHTGAHCHFAVIPTLQNEDFSWVNVAQQSSVMTFRDRKWSRKLFGMMRQVEWLLQSNDNNWDYTPLPLHSILSLFCLKSHLHSRTLDSQYFIFPERCMKWKIHGSLYSQS